MWEAPARVSEFGRGFTPFGEGEGWVRADSFQGSEDGATREGINPGESTSLIGQNTMSNSL